VPAIYEILEHEKESQYQSIPISENILNKKNITKIYEMRKIQPSGSSHLRTYDARDEKLFYQQAKFMENFEDDYNKEILFNSSIPTYTDMNIEQLRCYFSWRTQVRKGIINDTNISYAYVYIYELINLIGMNAPEDAFEKLVTFWQTFRSFNNKIDYYIKIWLKDLYICNDFSMSFKELVINAGLQEYYTDIFEDLSDYFSTYLWQLSNYELESSKFVNTNNEISNYIKKCFVIVVDNLVPLLNMYGASLEDLLKKDADAKSGIWHTPFDKAVYFQQKKKQNPKVIYISEREYYQFNGYNWYLYKSSVSKYDYAVADFIGYIVKKIESELRIMSGYKYRLSPNIHSFIDKMIEKHYCKNDNILIKIMLDTNFTSIISETIKACFFQSPSFDSSLLDKSTQKISIVKHLFSIANQEPYSTFIKMRKIKSEDASKNSLADKFCKQAELLHEITDDFDKIMDFSAAKPNFDEMANDQIRTYLTWRTKYNAGIVEPIPDAYVLLYASEVINLIEADTQTEVIEKLSALLHTYSGINAYLVKFLTDLIRDYYIYNPMDCSFTDIVLNSGLEDYYICNSFGDNRLKNPLLFYGKISNYKILNSKFYSDDTINILNDCFQECLRQIISVFFNKNNIVFRQALINKVKGRWWRPFREVIYKYPKIIRQRTLVRLNENEVYIYYHTSSRYEHKSTEKLDVAASHFIGYIFKRMESKVREITKHKKKLTVDAKAMAQKIPCKTENQIMISNMMLKQEFSDLIDETVLIYFQKNHPNIFIDPDSIYKKPIKVNVDFSKLDQIRTEAAEIQEKLLVTEEPPDEVSIQENTFHQANTLHQEKSDKIHKNIIENIPKNASKPNEMLDKWGMLISSLTNIQRETVSIILEGVAVSEKLAGLAISNHLLLEVLLEQINESALDYIGDNIIETGDSPVYIYDEYVNELFRVLKEIE